MTGVDGLHPSSYSWGHQRADEEQEEREERRRERARARRKVAASPPKTAIRVKLTDGKEQTVRAHHVRIVDGALIVCRTDLAPDVAGGVGVACFAGGEWKSYAVIQG